MAEARSEEEEESMRRETREQVVRRQPNSSGGRPDRRKPEHRHSQGPLSSLRAVIKRTSTRPTSVLETPRDRDRERDWDRDRGRDTDQDRDRRRPEITILSAEPLASTSWFPGAAGGIPPPPPPAAQIWGPTIPPAIQPPPSYEEVIREKTQEQVLLPSSSSSSSHPVSTITISTQTDAGPSPDPQESEVRRPVRPPRPPLPQPQKGLGLGEDVASTAGQSALYADGVVRHAPSETVAHASTDTPCCDLLTELCSPLTPACSTQTDQWDHSSAHAPPRLATTPPVPSERPTPRPRSKLGLQPISNSVKVQTLVKVREDGLATLARRAESSSTDQETSQGKYLQELLEAFSSDDWGFPDPHSDHSELSQSESEEENGEDMATLRARIQAFEQQQAADGNCGDANRQTGTGEGFDVPQRPEPRPRPRLHGQPAKPAPPVIAPKPKHFPPAPKPSSKVFWEDGGLTAPAEDPSAAEAAEASSAELNSELQTSSEPPQSSTTQSAPSLEVQPRRTTGNPALMPKPQSPTETPSSNAPAPVPAPRPPPPKFSPSLSGSPSPPNPRPPPRPPVAPRASVGAPPQDQTTVEVGSGTQVGSEPTQNTTTQTVKGGSVRPSVPTKPAAPTSPRRASAPNLAPKPITVLPTPSDLSPAPTKATPAPTATTPKLSGPAPAKPPSPAPATRKSSLVHSTSDATNPSSSDPPLPPRPSSVKLLPLRPPPIKSTPGRPPPPAISSSSSSQLASPPKVAPAPPVPAKTSPSMSSVSANQMQAQRAAKKGPPLPPRPKPGHPLYSSYMKQEVLIVLDDPSPTPSEHLSVEGKGPTTIPPVINPPQCLLDLETQPEPGHNEDSQSKPALEGLSLSDSQSILPEQKEQPDPSPVSGPRCLAVFDYEGEEEDELTFSQGDVIALTELIGQEWGRGQIHGRIGIFPLSFTEVVEPLPQPVTSLDETTKPVSAGSSALEPSPRPDPDMEEWAVALFDFPGQTEEDLSFHKGALIHVTEHVDAEWRRGELEGREGLYPAAFTQPWRAQPITGQQAAVKGTARAVFDFTAENEDELTLKVGDVITQVESVDQQWILGVVGGKRGIIPKNYISFL